MSAQLETLAFDARVLIDAYRRPAAEPEATPAVECDELDKTHRGWLSSYVSTCKASLADEVAQDTPDLVMVGYYQREIAKYQELLARAS